MSFLSYLINGISLGSVYAIIALGYTMVYGIARMLNFAHGDIIMVGGFTVFTIVTTMGGSPVVGILASVVVCTVLGVTIERVAYRPLRDASPLAVLITAIGVSYLLQNVALLIFGSNARQFTSVITVPALKLAADGQVIIKGAQGITGTPKTATFTIGIILVLLTLFIVLNIINSRTGRAIMAIRDNRIAAESVGINITKYKLMAFTISASLAGVAGVLYAHNLATLAATPKSFGYNMSIMILVFVVLGGIGNIRGSMIAAVILTLLPEMLRSLNNYRMLIYAVVLIVMMLLTSSPKAIEVRGRIFSSFRKKKTEGEA